MKSTLFKQLKSLGLLKEISKLAKTKKIKLFLVGGILRDAILERKKDNPDIDFCLKKGAINFGRAVSRELKAGFVVLDKSHGCARAVKRIKDHTYTLDFTDFRGKTLNQDLLHRDFTINSLALELNGLFKKQKWQDSLIDPYCGRRDLKSKIIRMINKEGFDEDPLRILRAFSLACLLGFKIDKNTLRQIQLKKKKISSVSCERIRDEIFKILSTGRGYEFICQLGKYRILDLIIPEIKPMRHLRQGPYHHLDVWAHSLATLKHSEAIIKSFLRNSQIRDYLEEEISSGRKRYELIKIVALLHDVAKPKTVRIIKGKITFYGHERLGASIVEELAVRLKLANNEIRALKQMTLCHLRPGYLANSPILTPRAKFRFFRDAGLESVSVLLVSLADQRATKGYLTVEKSRKRHESLIRRLIKEYFYKLKQKKTPRLVNGDDLIRHFRLEPSALIGKVLKALDELQAIGKIKNKKEALTAAARLIKN